MHYCVYYRIIEKRRSKLETREKQYNMLLEIAKSGGLSSFGLMANESWNNDPKRTLFTLSRYKFISRMFEGFNNVIEVGCADAFGTRLVQQTVNNVTVTDFDPVFIQDVESRKAKKWPLSAHLHDMVQDGPFEKEQYDGLFALDVLEHITKADERIFIQNCCETITPHGSLIFGMPSLESQSYASPQSKEGHVNCKTGADFKNTMSHFFHNVFMFSMNDEVVHTGFYPMSHYLFALCTAKK